MSTTAVQQLQALLQKAIFDDTADRAAALACVDTLAAAAKPLSGDIRRIHEAIADAKISIDVSTCDEDASNRLFGSVFGVQSDTKGGVTILVCEVEPNFTPAPRVQQFAQAAAH